MRTKLPATSPRLIAWFLITVAATSCIACATSPRAEGPARVNDSVPDKLAAQRAASGDLKLENEDERWGFEAARARRRDTVKKSRTDVFPMPSHTTDPAIDAGPTLPRP